MRKAFIITVDTEGDNLWSLKEGEKIKTENSKYILRFQELCEKYEFYPTYLVDYEMAQVDKFVEVFKQKASEGKCEIGMHLHAWNTPPDYEIEKKYMGQPYITEYPKDIVFAKHAFLKVYLEERFSVSILSYRSGRWATNEDLFQVLQELGIIVDCSVAPGISFKNCAGLSVCGGNNYRLANSNACLIKNKLLEVPMTSMYRKHFGGKGIKRKLRCLIKGEELWLRPAVADYEKLMRIVNYNKEKDFLEFMLHSSELMPGGSPYFQDENSIEALFLLLENFFAAISKDYIGMTLKEYAKEHM